MSAADPMPIDTPAAEPVPVAATRATPAAAPRHLRRVLSLDDFEAAARRRLPSMLFGYVAGGAETEATLGANRAAFDAFGLVPRVLVDTSQRSQATTLLGRTYAHPFGIAPMGASALPAYRGDLALARAAVAAGIPMVVSGAALIPLEDIRQAGAGWFQSYLPGEASRIEPMVARVAAAGYDTFVLTADVPVGANRENNVRAGFSIPLSPSARLVWQGMTHPNWLLDTGLRTLWRHGMPHIENMDAVRGPAFLSRQLTRALGQRDRLSWEHVRLIRRLWKGALVIKGVLSPDDAALAADCGVDGIIVSNHGGRQLDAASASLRALPDIAARAGGMAVMFDGGIRRGTDVLKALALGANFVFLGRSFLYAAAVAGEAGVAHAINLLSTEIDRDMALMGVCTPGELGPGHLAARAFPS
jgi:L-lactate dehydrogenase (cytochrome)